MVLEAEAANEVRIFPLKFIDRKRLTALYHEDLRVDAVHASRLPTPY
jgi:hypothetical protein